MFRINIPAISLFVAMIAVIAAVLPIVIIAYAAPQIVPEENLPGSQTLPIKNNILDQITQPLSSIEYQNCNLSDEQIKLPVFLHSSGETVSMSLHNYLCCVMMAEVPYTFHEEALKAMAVAARTYALFKLKNADAYCHDGGAVICTDYSHCMAYLSYEGAVERWSEKWADIVYPKMDAAVSATDGMVVCYDGELINALFHAMSCSYTASAKEVWGSDIPYLVSTSSPETDEIDGFTSTVTFSADEFRARLSGICRFEGNPSGYVGQYWYDASGRVEKLMICGTEISGTRVRELLKLRSCRFYISYQDGNFVIKTKGYGHGVGLSQYGANVLAQDGCDFKQILEHYYNGTCVEALSPKIIAADN